MQWNEGDYEIITDSNKMDLDVIHQFLSKYAYWCIGIPKDTVAKSIDNSLCFGVFKSDNQIGFGRLITDKATFAYLADVFILPEYRGIGLSKWLMGCINQHPDVQGLRRLLLVTQDAQELYRQFGYKPIETPERFMTLHKPGLYQSNNKKII